MGKHDRQETFSWQPAPDDFYKARIATLEKENQELNNEIHACEYKEELMKGVISEYKEEIEGLKNMVAELKEALCRAALREV